MCVPPLAPRAEEEEQEEAEGCGWRVVGGGSRLSSRTPQKKLSRQDMLRIGQQVAACMEHPQASQHAYPPPDNAYASQDVDVWCEEAAGAGASRPPTLREILKSKNIRIGQGSGGKEVQVEEVGRVRGARDRLQPDLSSKFSIGSTSAEVREGEKRRESARESEGKRERERKREGEGERE